MKSVFRGYHLFLITTLLAVLIIVPLVGRAWAGWEHYDPNTSNLPSSQINTLAMDPNRLWIGTGEGLVKKTLSSDDPNTGWIKDLKVDPNLYAPVSSMDVDQNMVLWLGTPQGLISFDPDESSDPNNPHTYNGLSFTLSDNISDIEVDSDFVWVATDLGLNRLEKSSGAWIRYSDDPNDPNGFDSYAALAVASGDDDTIWVLPRVPDIFGGVYRYTVSTGQWDHFSIKAGQEQTEVNFNSLIMGNSNDIWLGTYGYGLWRFETNNPDPNDAWTQWEDVNSGLPSNDIQAIGIYQGTNRIIVATIGGIARYDFDLDLWQPISTPAYMDLSSLVITDILVDSDNNRVWFGTEEEGLYLWKEGAIVWSNPADGEENVSIDTNAIEIVFNKPIDPYSIELGGPGSSLTFEMFDSARNPITDPNIYDPNDFDRHFLDSNTNIHLVIEPKQPNYIFNPDTWYRFTFTTDILYGSGETIGVVDTRVEFKTIIVPEVVSTDPVDGALGVNPYAPIQIWFNKPMAQDSFFPNMISFQAEGDIFFTPVYEEEMDFPDDPNHLVISISGNPPFLPGTEYIFIVNKNVTDISGNPLAEDYELQFTTKSPPQIIFLSGFSPYPEDSATNVSVDTNISVIFNSSMDTNSVERSFSLAPTVTGEFLWFDSDTRVVFQPDNPLTSGTEYEVTVDTNATDKFGIPINYPFEIPYIFSFTTDYTTTILSSFPPDNEDSVSIYANIGIIFSGPMNKSSVEGAFSLLDDQNTPVSGGFSWNQSSTGFSFVPSDPLDPNHNYKASITTSAQSETGSPLAQGKTWQFTTVSLETVSPPEGGWPVYNIMGMDPNLVAVTAMALDPNNGRIWAGLATLDPNSNWMGSGLFYYDGNDWKQYTTSDPNCGLTSDSINDLAFDSQGNLWIATEPGPTGGGLSMFDGQTWHWYDPNTFYGLSGDDNFLYVNAIDVYFTGTEDFIWVATTGGIAVGRYNSNSNDWNWAATTAFPFSSLIAVDNLGGTGTAWVASELFFMYDPNEPCNSITGFDADKLSKWQPDLLDPNIRVWSPDGGLLRMKSPEERINSNLRAMIVDGSGNLWLGTKDRLYKINIDDLLAGECNFESCNYIETKGGLLPSSIYDMIINPANTNELWIATDSGISILKINEPIKSPDSWTRYPLTDAIVLTMRAGSNGEVFAGTDKGLLTIGDTIKPTVIASYPSDGGTNIPVGGPFWVSFSELMNHAATETAFTLSDANSIEVAGTLSWAGTKLIFEPDENLESVMQYSMRVDTNASDLSLNQLSQTYQADFTTSGSWILAIYPAQGEQSVPLDLKIQINFAELMNTSSTQNAFCLRVDPNAEPGSQCVNGNFNWFNSNQLLEFTPTGNLDQETNYILTIDSNAKNQTGTSMPESFTLGFKTESVTPESWILSTYPAQGGQSVPIDLKIQINFTRPMNTSSTQSAFCLRVDPNIEPGSQCVIGSFEWLNNDQLLEFTPGGNLDQGTNYILTIDTNAEDQTGASMPELFTLGFKTGSWILSTYPLQGEQSVPIDLKIQINFTRPMDTNSTQSAFCLRVDPDFDPTSQCVTGSFNWLNYQSLEFIPVGSLNQGTNYILTIDTNAEDQTGASMPESFILGFKTVSTNASLKFEGVGCFIQSLENGKKGVFARLKDWLNFSL
ncbi:MAG: Ig-like domain-containing protein [bacterium]